MKRALFLLMILFAIDLVSAQDIDFIKDYNCSYQLNQSYGESERNVFDVILPNDSVQHGLAIYIHGGGFYVGDKSELYSFKSDLISLLESNIAVATINYSFFKKDDSLGVRVCLDDVKRAIQYFRHNASRYNIDKEKVGAFGVSAGAGSSLYYAFHDDMAIPGDTTILGESTRLKCAAAMETQSTYDVFSWKKIVPGLGFILLFKKQKMYNAGANFYGYPNYKSFKPYLNEITAELDMLRMIDIEDPPIYLRNSMKEKLPLSNRVVQHHKSHAEVVSKILNEFDVENKLYTNKNLKAEDYILPVGEFLIQYLK